MDEEFRSSTGLSSSSRSAKIASVISVRGEPELYWFPVPFPRAKDRGVGAAFMSSTQNPKLGMCNRWVVEVRDREREKDGEKQRETGWG